MKQVTRTALPRAEHAEGQFWSERDDKRDDCPGASMLTVVIVTLLLGVVLSILRLSTWPHLPSASLIWVPVGLLILTPVIFSPIARILWRAIAPSLSASNKADVEDRSSTEERKAS